MKKKTKNRLKILLGTLALGMVIGLLFTRHEWRVMHTKWRAPVHVVIPSLSTESQKLVADFPDIDYRDIHLLRQKFGDKLVESTPTMSDLEKAKDLLEKAIDLPTTNQKEQTDETSNIPMVMPPDYKSAGRQGRIAIIIDDMGLNILGSKRAVRLPASVTLSYMTYADDLQNQTEEAAKMGHDLMLHLPMEPLGAENPGPNALFVGQTDEEWARRLDFALDRFEGYVGVNNHMGSKFTKDVKGMTFVSESLHERGVFFVDSRTTAQSIVQEVMSKAGVKTAARDVFIDDSQRPQDVRYELARAEQVARRKGQAIVIGHPHNVTLQILEEWIPDAKARGFEIVPAKELVK